MGGRNVNKLISLNRAEFWGERYAIVNLSTRCIACVFSHKKNPSSSAWLRLIDLLLPNAIQTITFLSALMNTEALSKLDHENEASQEQRLFSGLKPSSE
jgi:hypothetical protein